MRGESHGALYARLGVPAVQGLADAVWSTRRGTSDCRTHFSPSLFDHVWQHPHHFLTRKLELDSTPQPDGDTTNPRVRLIHVQSSSLLPHCGSHTKHIFQRAALSREELPSTFSQTNKRILRSPLYPTPLLQTCPPTIAGIRLSSLPTPLTRLCLLSTGPPMPMLPFLGRTRLPQPMASSSGVLTTRAKATAPSRRSTMTSSPDL